jgi:hypothetical protein
LYTGDCETLTCADHNDDTITDESSLFAEFLEQGQTYYLLVHGFDQAQGDFELVTETIEPVRNDACSAAIELTVGESLSGDALAATMNNGLPFCGW